MFEHVVIVIFGLFWLLILTSSYTVSRSIRVQVVVISSTTPTFKLSNITDWRQRHLDFVVWCINGRQLLVYVRHAKHKTNAFPFGLFISRIIHRLTASFTSHAIDEYLL